MLILEKSCAPANGPFVFGRDWVVVVSLVFFIVELKFELLNVDEGCIPITGLIELCPIIPIELFLPCPWLCPSDEPGP
jgi:hypothetical protein